MQTRGLARWFSEQGRRTRAQLRSSRKGRGVRSGPCLLCTALALVVMGAMLGIRITNVITQGGTDAADQYWQAEGSRFLEENPENPLGQTLSSSEALLTGASGDATTLPTNGIGQQPGSQREEEAEDAPFQGLWQHRPGTLNPTDPQSLSSTGAGSQAQHAQQGLSLQQGHSSSSYSSADSRATEHAVADTLTAGNSTQSALPGQQDSLVDKVVGKLLPAAVTSKEAAEPEENSQVAGPNGAYYGGVLDSAGNQTLNDSTDSEPKATKVPNWTSLLNDNGTTPIVSSVLDLSKPASSLIKNLAEALPEPGSAAVAAQNTSSSSSTLATAGRVGSSQNSAKALPTDPTQSQANTMLSQAGLPANQPRSNTNQPRSNTIQPQDLALAVGTNASQIEQPRSQPDANPSLGLSTSSTRIEPQTESGKSQAGLSQSLGLSDKPVQGSQAKQGAGGAVGFPEDWHWESYLQLNPDVAAASGRDEASARQHWQDWGRSEKRQYKMPSTVGRRTLTGEGEAAQQPWQAQGSSKLQSRFGWYAAEDIGQSKAVA